MSAGRMPGQPRKRVIEIDEVCFKTSWSRSAIYAIADPKSEMHDPSWPLPIQLGRRKVVWVEAEVDAWLDAKISQARHTSAPIATHFRPPYLEDRN